jgi:hypothetical protein
LIWFVPGSEAGPLTPNPSPPKQGRGEKEAPPFPPAAGELN